MCMRGALFHSEALGALHVRRRSYEREVLEAKAEAELVLDCKTLCETGYDAHVKSKNK